MKKLDMNHIESLEVKSDNFCFSKINYFPSPNNDERPDDVEPRLIVIHGISLPPGEYGNNHIKSFFLNRLDSNKHSYFKKIKYLRVSPHLLIDRDGQLSQFVPFNRRAWHAGASHYQGIDNCNDYSIGIELEGVDDNEYTELQYQILAKVIQSLMRFYPIISSRKVVAHSDIAPFRKTDPGKAFDWFKLYEYIDTTT
jgi:AmpD protein|tara:strand:+ start:384 stop:974 length:591 start_codon:yes stop_codon:yes gene_type:complete